MGERMVRSGGTTQRRSPMHRSIILSAALAASALVAETAWAKPMTQCQLRYSFCGERCINNNNGDKIAACFARTCDHQYKACARDSGESSDPYHDRKGMREPKGGRVRRLASPPQDDVRGPLAGGILNQG